MKPALLHLPAGPLATASRADLSLTAVDHRRGVALTELPGLLGRRAVVLVVPALQGVVSRVAIPAAQARQAARALPWAVEDALLEGPDHYQVGLGPPDAGAWLVVWVARDWLLDWLQRLHELGLKVLAWMPEAAMLPASDGAWLLLDRGDGWLLQTGPGAVMVVAESDLPACLALLPWAGPGRPTLRVYAEAAAQRRLQAVLEASNLGLTIEPGADWAALAGLAWASDDTRWWQGLPGEAGGATERGRRRRVLRRLGAGLAAYALAGLSLQGQDAELTRALAARRAQAEALVREAFPELRRVVRPRTQMEQGLAALRRAAGLQGALALLGTPLQQLPAVRLQTLDYTPEVWRLVLHADALLTLDHFTEVVNQALPDYRARLESAEPVGDEFAGVIRIEPKPQ